MTGKLEPLPESSTDILHQVFDQSSQGFQVIGEDWRYYFINPAAAQQGKSSPEDLIGKTMMEAYPGIEKTPLFKLMRKVMKEEVSIKMENEFVFPDGDKGWFQLFIHPWDDGIMIFSVDITDRKKEERALAEKIKNLSEHLSKSELGRKKLSELKLAFQKLVESRPSEIPKNSL